MILSIALGIVLAIGIIYGIFFLYGMYMGHKMEKREEERLRRKKNRVKYPLSDRIFNVINAVIMTINFFFVGKMVM